GSVWPDWTVPKELFGDVIFRADSIERLAEQLEINPQSLSSTVARFNEHAESGVDPDFARGESVYDHFVGDPSRKPNCCLGPVSKGPFYAVRVDLGDIGT